MGMIDKAGTAILGITAGERGEAMRGRMMSQRYIERRFAEMEREAGAYWKDWLASGNSEDLKLSGRYRRKAYYYLKKISTK